MATTLPRNADVAEQLELLADLLEIEGQAAFRVLAYRRAAQRVRDTGGPVAQLALDGKAKELPGIGATIQDKIVQIVNTGEIEAPSKRRKTIPPEVAAKGPTKATVVSHEGFRFDLRVVPPECYGNLLQHFTGSKDHNIALREDAQRRGLSVSEYGVTETESGEVFTAETEEELYERLGYAFIPPELRENGGELEAARRDELPDLVATGQLRGDLHTHSHWSADGKNTLVEMVEAARERGYAYYAITDHSHYLREGRLGAQAKEIDRLAKRVAPLKLLKGVEVNIKADGTLDMPDELLAERDWVVASIHTAFQREPTERVIAAMENPHVDVIGHLTGRKLSRRAPLEIDSERVVEKARERGTFLEINSQPDRLDLSDVNARLAGEAGVKIVVSSDAHQLKALDYVDFGIAQARRAWLTPHQIANTRTLAQLRKLMKK